MANLKLAETISIIALIVSAIAALMTHQNGVIARAADRAWLGSASMKLSERPMDGKGLEFLLEYQNTGRQPALDVAWYLDSHVLSPIASTARYFASQWKHRRLFSSTAVSFIAPSKRFTDVVLFQIRSQTRPI
ncbi:hypothetical protein SAMN05216338_101327 [Bradyrhizobium sp. Rc2d]|nr:hypothetical protein SAMN05216338_101327 [Bradyrhizobium sp. Rc2d]